MVIEEARIFIRALEVPEKSPSQMITQSVPGCPGMFSFVILLMSFCGFFNVRGCFCCPRCDLTLSEPLTYPCENPKEGRRALRARLGARLGPDWGPTGGPTGDRLGARLGARERWPSPSPLSWVIGYIPDTYGICRYIG